MTFTLKTRPPPNKRLLPVAWVSGKPKDKLNKNIFMKNSSRAIHEGSDSSQDWGGPLPPILGLLQTHPGAKDQSVIIELRLAVKMRFPPLTPLTPLTLHPMELLHSGTAKKHSCHSLTNSTTIASQPRQLSLYEENVFGSTKRRMRGGFRSPAICPQTPGHWPQLLVFSSNLPRAQFCPLTTPLL